MLTVQDALLTLQKFWTDRGCLVAQPFNTEVGAGTMNPATVLRVLGPEPWRVAYVEPSVRPDDSRYGQNPNRLQTHTQFQVILKPDPGNPQEIYLESLRALGIDTDAHDIRFVEDNWAQPAIGAWGLGWEVWMDGLEITQFTYFQQVGGQNLEPVSVELTYGMERILMAVQGVEHFKDMVYAEGVTYGEIYGQNEYEMSRYYLDDADVEANTDLFNHYIAEAERMVEARLPVPAHTYVLKSSHAFNVRDARGAISTTERAQAFAKIRRLARDVSKLWVERREELGFPLLDAPAPKPVGEAVTPPTAGAGPSPDFAGKRAEYVAAGPQNFALELGFEELPPHVLAQAIEQVRAALTEGLAGTRLAHGEITVEGTPRRIVAAVESVAGEEPDAQVLRKGPRVSAAFDAEGNPTKAAEGFARGQKAAVADLTRAEFGGAEHLAYAVTEAGRDVFDVLAGVITGIVKSLRADKNMRWADPELAYSRPIRWLVALWGGHIVPVEISQLRSGRTTYALRGDAQPLVQIDSADVLAPILAQRGIVLSTGERLAQIRSGAGELAASVGGSVDLDGEAELVEEISGLVEAPHGILGNFDPDYLRLPEDILTTVMRIHQRYLPVRAEDGGLLPHFITFANGACDETAVRAGNENVLRARYEDAAFFYDADLKVPLADFRADIAKLTFENRLGSMAKRADRIRDVAAALAGALDRAGTGLDESEAATLARAGELAKFDLATDMVVELSSLAGVMAKEYARKAGETPAVAEALFELELPRHTGDALPASTPGALLALADRFDLLMAMFAVGAKPTGSSDPFALRRAALGAAMILRAHGELGALDIPAVTSAAAERLRAQGIEIPDDAEAAVVEFVTGRFAQLLRDEGVSAEAIAAVEPLLSRPDRAAALLEEIAAATGAVTAADGPARAEFAALVEQVQRITRIVPRGTSAAVQREHLSDPAELVLADAIADLPDHAGSSLGDWAADAAQITGALTTFFDEVLVMAEDEAVREARLSLLQTVVDRAPAGVNWRALDNLLG